MQKSTHKMLVKFRPQNFYILLLADGIILDEKGLKFVFVMNEFHHTWIHGRRRWRRKRRRRYYRHVVVPMSFVIRNSFFRRRGRRWRCRRPLLEVDDVDDGNGHEWDGNDAHLNVKKKEFKKVSKAYKE